MSPRIRQISDTEVLAAAATVIATLGQRATLADVAAAAGIAPPTLIQRYDSKRGLLMNLARQGFGGAAEALGKLIASLGTEKGAAQQGRSPSWRNHRNSRDDFS